MKPELRRLKSSRLNKFSPLKGKIQSHCHKSDHSDRHDVHDDEDIKSAVEWLKEKLREHKCLKTIENTNYWIDQAFEDVMKK